MDDLDRQKRRHYIAGILATSVLLIRVILQNLDGIGLAHHTGPDTRDRIADDFMMVYANILPALDASPEVVALLRSTLLDWVTLDSLVKLETISEIHDSRSDAMEELAERIGMSITIARENWPELFEFEIE